MTCKDCIFRDVYDGKASFCVRFPPVYKANGKCAYPQIEEKTRACGEYKVKEK